VFRTDAGKTNADAQPDSPVPHFYQEGIETILGSNPVAPTISGCPRDREEAIGWRYRCLH